jgi:hypothetical protein
MSFFVKHVLHERYSTDQDLTPDFDVDLKEGILISGYETECITDLSELPNKITEQEYEIVWH